MENSGGLTAAVLNEPSDRLPLFSRAKLPLPVRKLHWELKISGIIPQIPGVQMDIGRKSLDSKMVVPAVR